MTCPVCKKKWHGLDYQFADHVDRCANTYAPIHENRCPKCGEPLIRVVKAAEHITELRHESSPCAFQLELFPGGKPA